MSKILWWPFTILALVGYGILAFDVIAGIINGTFVLLDVLIVVAIYSIIDYALITWIGNAAVDYDATPGLPSFGESIGGAIVAIVLGILSSPVTFVICIYYHIRISIEIVSG